MPSIDKRIAALEQKKAPNEQITIIRRIVWEAQESAEIKQLRDELGASWSRGQSETELAFIERVKAEAWRNKWGVMILNGFIWGERDFFNPTGDTTKVESRTGVKK